MRCCWSYPQAQKLSCRWEPPSPANHSCGCTNQFGGGQQSPEDAGIQPLDVITSIDGQLQISKGEDYMKAFSEKKPGQQGRIEFYRCGIFEDWTDEEKLAKNLGELAKNESNRSKQEQLVNKLEKVVKERGEVQKTWVRHQTTVTLVAYDKTRASWPGCPLRLVSATIERNSIGEPTISVTVQAKSLVVEAFEIEAHCFDRFNREVFKFGVGDSTYSGLSQTTIQVSQSYTATWTLHGHDTAAKASIVLTAVKPQDAEPWKPAKGQVVRITTESSEDKEKKAADEQTRAAEAAHKAAEESAKAEKDRKAVAEAAKWRTWTDSTGSHRIDAKFSGIIAGKVKLIKRDGTTFQVPVEKLSDADQEWINNRKPSHAQTDPFK